ncbi:hypothetical protein DVH24_007904 [Malus domestica]|uniref:Uncharacterized protein n=1 Tax=Malus domestica TaxID=3750 RepID=A0A498JNI0_MALDO|nr:hypothetical protein DVH24_007904 [Malus domestica]
MEPEASELPKGLHEAFWELTGSGFHQNSKLSEFAREQSHNGRPTGKFSYEFPKTKL